MRLLHATRLEFQAFFDADVPPYAILSHRWGDSTQEVSYTDFIAGEKRDTVGYEKIIRLCRMTVQRAGLQWCWIDTCCIDKTNSAELSEAINSMFSWYQGAAICYSYLRDVSHFSDSGFATQLRVSDLFFRGWTLQELIAPEESIFCDQHWEEIGDKRSLAITISEITGISRDLLAGTASLDQFSIAQKMSWAARRMTSRKEDEAYCLLGIFRVNMPLLYGEKGNAFRRLQEIIMSKTDDNSLFAWAQIENSLDVLFSARGRPSILAASAVDFIGCGEIERGLTNQRVLFELTNRGVMLLIHRSYDPNTLGTLVKMAHTYLDNEENLALGLTLPLGCIRYRPRIDGIILDSPMEYFYLRLVLDNSKWRYVGVTKHADRDAFSPHLRKQAFAYDNDHVRFCIHHDQNDDATASKSLTSTSAGKTSPLHWMHLRVAESVAHTEIVMRDPDIRPGHRRPRRSLTFRCPRCNRMFALKIDMRRHLSRHNTAAKRGARRKENESRLKKTSAPGFSSGLL